MALKVLVREAARLAVMAALHQMDGQTGQMDARMAGHNSARLPAQIKRIWR